MGKTKDKLDGLRLVRRCWSRPEDESINHTKFDCIRDKCPYANGECEAVALIDAIDLAEKLYRRLKKKEGHNGVDPHK